MACLFAVPSAAAYVAAYYGPDSLQPLGAVALIPSLAALAGSAAWGFLGVANLFSIDEAFDRSEKREARGTLALINKKINNDGSVRVLVNVLRRSSLTDIRFNELLISQGFVQK